MTDFITQILVSEYEKYTDKKQGLLDNLMTIIIESEDSYILEGNVFYQHLTTNIQESLIPKQLNMFWCGKHAKSKICEIGFNAGHSAFLMLLGRDKTPIDFTIFDIGEHTYTKPCLKYIISKFPHVNYEYIEGDSVITIPTWINYNPKMIGVYDIVHVDGGHAEICIFNDMKNADILVKIGGLIIIDDTDQQHINKYVDEYLMNGRYTECFLIKLNELSHRIIQKTR